MALSYDELTAEHFEACMNWIAKMSSPTKWNLSTEEVAILLGMNVGEYNEMKDMSRKDHSFSLRNESAERISLLLGIWKRLQLLGFDEPTAISVFNRANKGELLRGKSIKQFLLENNSTAAFYSVNIYLETSGGYVPKDF